MHFLSPQVQQLPKVLARGYIEVVFKDYSFSYGISRLCFCKPSNQINLKLNNYLIYMTHNTDQQTTTQPKLPQTYQPQTPSLILLPSFNNSKSKVDRHWTRKQQLKYATFLICFQHQLEDPAQRKKFKIYQMMADMITTKNEKQCKNYFVKSMKSGITVAQTIQRIKGRHKEKSFEEKYQKYRIVAETICNQQKYKIPQLPHSPTISPIYTFNSQPLSSTSLETTPVIMASETPWNFNQINNWGSYKNEIVRTEAYTLQGHSFDEDAEQQGIPLMRIDSCSQVEEQYDNLDQYNKEHSQQCWQQHKSKPLFDVDNLGSYKLTSYGKKYYCKQKKRREMQRQLHLMNIQYLSSKLMKQKEQIKYFESAIKLLHLTFNMAGTLI